MEWCPDHPEEKLRFVCLPCDQLVCRDCKMTEHEGHRSVDIVKATADLGGKLEDHRRRLQQRKTVLNTVKRELQEDQAAATRMQEKMKERINRRVALLALWLKQAEISALNSLKTATMEVDCGLDCTSSDVTGRVQEIDDMITSIDTTMSTIGQPTFNHIAALRLERDMRTGRGKGENLERLTEGLPIYSVRPSLLCDDGSLTEVMVRRFIGTALYTQVSKRTPKVALSPLFRCTKVPDARINAICPLPDGQVWVAHDVLEEESSEQRVCLYSHDGHCLRKQKLPCRVSISRAYENWVCVLGQNVQKKLINDQETREDPDRADDERCFIALSKLNARFSIGTSGKLQGNVIYKMEARSVLSLTMASVRFFPITARLPHALDVDSAGQYFAVLALDPPSVQLYCPPVSKPLSVYRPSVETFCPSDVCFHLMDGKEFLLVADWFNNAVYVLSYKDSLSFQGFLGEGCPLISQPTALTTDDDSRLWIGCKGGQVLLCVAADEVSRENSECSDDELSDS